MGVFGAARDSALAEIPLQVTYAPRSGLLRLTLTNFVLNILTLFVYRFWAKTRVRRHVWSCVHINGEPLEYTGTGKELFLGAMIVLVVFILPLVLLAVGATLWFGQQHPVAGAMQFLGTAMVLLLTAFRTAWPAFAYSIEDEREAKRAYGFVLTYLVLVTTWVATSLTLLSPWLVRWLSAPAFADASRVVGPLAFAAVAFGGYIVVAIGVGRARRTQFNWVVTGAAAVVNASLNLILIPRYGGTGAAIAWSSSIIFTNLLPLAQVWKFLGMHPFCRGFPKVALAAGASYGALGLVLRTALGASLPVFVAVMVQPSLGILTVWFGVLVAIVARAIKNHTRVQGDAWMRSADSVT